MREFEGECWTLNKGWTTSPPPDKSTPESYGLNVLKHSDAPGLSTDPDVVHGGSNSGYQAVGLARHLGALWEDSFTRILLLGYDMQLTGGKSHFFGDHPPEIRNGGDPGRFVSAYRTIDPNQYGIEIINCSRETALDMFPRSTIDDI